MFRYRQIAALLILTLLMSAPYRVARATCTVTAPAVVIPPGDEVWIEDAWVNQGESETTGGAPTSSEWPVTTAQRASGSASFPDGYTNAEGMLDLVAYFPEHKQVSGPSNFVAYLLVSNCDPPPMGVGVEFTLYDDAGTRLVRYYWGEQMMWETDDGLGLPVRLGSLPVAGQWTRLEMPTNLVAGAQALVASVRLLVSQSASGDPLVWWDHIGVAPASAPPTITAVAPSLGPTAGGTSVAISGTGFVAGRTAVTFGGRAAASVSVASATSITAVAPAGGGTVDVAVETPGGTATRTGAFTYVAPPTLSGITPFRGAVAGGQTIALAGTNFVAGETSVTFGGAAASVSNVTATSLEVTSPAHSAGTVDVSVTTPGGSVTGVSAFRYVERPNIHSFSPSEGTAGTLVTLTGTFDVDTSATSASIGGVPAVVVSGTLTQLVVRVPAGAQTGAITVVTPGGAAVSVTQFVVPVYSELWIEPSTVTLNIGDVRRLAAKARTTDGATRDVTTSTTWSSGNPSTVTVTATGQVEGLARGTVTVTAQLGTPSASATVQVIVIDTPPPDPASIAPPTDPTRATSFVESVAFLHTGANAIQRGVVPGALVPRRLTVVRGRISDATGAPLTGVRVATHRDSNAGYSVSRTDGAFDLVVNGGGTVTLVFTKDGYVPAHRTAATPWNDFVVLDEIRMVEYDAAVTTIRLSELAANAVARGTPVSDEHGSRRATMLFQPGTGATMQLANGTVQALPEIRVRVTEQSVGKIGAMPAELPQESAYTYCVELSVDEATAAGATRVDFTKPVLVYVENFLGFPTGGRVPAGYYDREAAAWVPSNDGRVIKVLAVENGSALIDTDGDTVADDGAQIGVTDSERRTLGSLYSGGQSLWRVAVSHFTPWDLNWGWGLPDGATAPDMGPPVGEQSLWSESCHSGSLIECESLSVGQSIPVAGTPLTLEYRSRNMPGYRPKSDVIVKLSGENVPASLKRIDVEFMVAGKKETASFAPSQNLTRTFSWSGADVYGRPLYTDPRAKVSIRYVYDTVFRQPTSGDRSFGSTGSLNLGIPARREAVLTQDFLVPLRGPRPDQALGGWTLSDLDVYDATARMIRRGAGSDIALASRGLDLKPISNISGAPIVTTGPDGSIYTMGISRPATLRRITPDGVVTTVAGGGTTPPADGVSAIGAYLGISNAGVVASGEMVFLEDYTDTLYRIDERGLLRTLATGAITQMAVAGGGVLFVDSSTSSLNRVDTRGNVTLVLGKTETASLVRKVTGIAVSGTSGMPYVMTYEYHPDEPYSGDDVIYRGVAPVEGAEIKRFTDGTGPAAWAIDGAGRVVFPGRSSTTGMFYVDSDGEVKPLAAASTFGVAGSLAFLPNGDLVYSASHNQQVCPLVSGRYSCTVAGGYPVAAIDATTGGFQGMPPDGALGLHFNAAGKHVETRDPQFGTVITRVAYDSGSGLATHIENASGLVTRIERNGSGAITGITAPNGQRTEVLLGRDGLIAEIRGPGGVTHQFEYGPGGMMRSHRDPRGKTSTYEFDAAGRLRTATDATGATKALGHTKSGVTETVTLTTPEGNTWRYVTTRADEGSTDRTMTDPRGLTGRSIATPTSLLSISPDGTRTDTALTNDSIWRTLAPVPVTTKVLYPSGRTITAQHTRSYSGVSTTNPYGFSSVTERTTVNGRTVTTTIYPAMRSVYVTSPLGRAVEQYLNAQGRVQEVRWPGKAPVGVQYDTRGRVTAVTQGARAHRISWDANDRITSMSRPDGRTYTFDYDAAGRLTSQVFGGTRTVSFTYDAAGNVLSIIPPGRPAHVFHYNDAGLPDAYDGPDEGATQYLFDRDRQLTSIVEPGGATMTLSYDRGRLQRVTGGSRTLSLAYYGGGQLRQISDSQGPAVSFAFDGPLPTQMSWAGDVSGNVTWSYDSSLRIVGEAVNGSHISYAYDDDGLLIAAGAERLTRDGVSGRLKGTALGVVSDSYTHNGFGEVSRYVTQQSTSSVFTVDYVRDAVGRVVTKNETRFGFSASHTYSYDPHGRLEIVKENGTVIAKYAYDANGNRTSVERPSGTVVATYDAADRLIAYGDTTFTYNPSGFRTTKVDASGTTRYEYDQFGNLRKVIRPDSSLIEYIIDASDRRVGKRVNGTVVRRWLYGDDRRVIAELDSAGGIVARYVYASRSNVPDYVVRDGSTFRFVVDHLGSVRYVLGATDGTIMQSMNYDEFGQVIFDSNPGFQPFGFAGGLYDSDTGLVRFGARDYDAVVGRWTGKDPIGFGGGDTNLYGYALSDPINLIDPSGLLFEGSVNAGEAYGEDALNYYADMISDPESAWYTVLAGYLGGGLSALWTPCTSDRTFLTLTAAYGASGAVTRYGAATEIGKNATPWWRYVGPKSNPHSRWMTRGAEPPYGTNWGQAKSGLQLPNMPNGVQKVPVKWWEPVRGPRLVSGNEQWGAGGGVEYARGWTWPK